MKQSSTDYSEDVAMEGIPTYIEIAPRNFDSMDYDYCTDDDSQTEEDFNMYEDEYDLTHEDLDALKMMVQEMRDNPNLLFCSPVYSKSTIALTMSTRTPPTRIASPRAVSSPLADRDMARSPFIPITHYADPTFLCQECCNTLNLCSPSPSQQFHPLSIVQEIPPLPFQD